NRSASPAPSRTCSEPLQHAQQLRQGVGVKPAPDFNPTAARQGHRQTAARRAAGGLLHLHPAVPGRRVALRPPLPIAGQRGQAQPLLPAELNLAQPAGFIFGYQLPGFRATPPVPRFHHLCLLVHPFTASRTSAREQMGWSDAYGSTSSTRISMQGKLRTTAWASGVCAFYSSVLLNTPSASIQKRTRRSPYT